MSNQTDKINPFKTEREIMIDLLKNGNLAEYKTKLLEKKQKELTEKLLKMRDNFNKMKLNFFI